MTLGFTGVIWAARPPEVQSAMLNAGTHGISAGLAAPAWGSLAALWEEATLTVAWCIAELGVSMQGINGLGAIARLGGFAAWTQAQAGMAAALGIETAAHAAAYNLAFVAMPTPPEIIAADTARVASHATGGDLVGAGEAAEAYYVFMHTRATIAMEIYEAVSTAMLSVPISFPQPPPIANGAGGVAAFLGDTGDAATNAVWAATQAAPGALSSALSQIGTVSSTVASAGSTAISAVSEIGTQAVSAATGVGNVGALSGGVGALGALGGAGAAGVAGSVSYTGNFGGTKVPLPEGWGMGAPVTPAASGAGPQQMARPSAPQHVGQQPARRTEDDEDEHETPEYLKNFEHFADGRTVGPSVIGEMPEAENR